MPETTQCMLCGTENAQRATMCAWCETSLVDPYGEVRRRQSAGGRARVDLYQFDDSKPYGPDPVDRWLASIGSFLVVSTLVCIALACPVAVTLLLHKQEAVDNAARYYSGPGSPTTSEFPGYGALSIIPSLTFALTIYLLFRWITRRRDGDGDGW